jgi:predicted negative regulator of RcsB-dependent stress response
MAIYDLEEQDQIEDLKAWWAQYGIYVTAAVTTVAVVVIGVQGWRWYQSSQAEKASVLYQAVSQAARANDAAKAKDPATQIETQFGGTAYAPRAALLYAHLLYDAGDKSGAKTQLQWIIDHAAEEELKAVARFRLAQLLLDEKAYDEALRAIDVKTDDAFAAIYADLRGDILAAAGKAPTRGRRTRVRSPNSIRSLPTGPTCRPSSTHWADHGECSRNAHPDGSSATPPAPTTVATGSGPGRQMRRSRARA